MFEFEYKWEVPLLGQGGIIQHRAHDASTMIRRVRVVGSDEQSDLRSNGLDNGSLFGYESQVSDTLV